MKRDEDKDKKREATNTAAAVAAGLQLNDASATRRRGKMMLPTPQVSFLHRSWAPHACMLFEQVLWQGQIMLLPIIKLYSLSTLQQIIS